MKAHLSYLHYILRHKWFVFLECARLGIFWRGIVHDLSKFRPSEWLPYVRYFYNPDGSDKARRDDSGYYDAAGALDAEFNFAWLLHQKRNRHHWQWWILPEDEGGIKTLPMADRYRREMLADWRGVSRARFGWDNTSEWYNAHRDKMQLHPETRTWVETQLT